MKIMVYYMAVYITQPTSEQRQRVDDLAAHRLAELKKEYPGLNIKVIAAYGAAHDRIEVADMSIPYYPAQYNTTYPLSTGPTYGYPPTVTTSFVTGTVGK